MTEVQEFKIKDTRNGLYYGGSSWRWVEKGGKVYKRAGDAKSALTNMRYYNRIDLENLVVEVVTMQVVRVTEVDTTRFRRAY